MIHMPTKVTEILEYWGLKRRSQQFPEVIKLQRNRHQNGVDFSMGAKVNKTMPFKSR